MKKIKTFQFSTYITLIVILVSCKDDEPIPIPESPSNSLTQLGDHFGAWGNLEYSVKTGGIAFDNVEGMSVWKYYEENPEDGMNFMNPDPGGDRKAGRLDGPGEPHVGLRPNFRSPVQFWDRPFRSDRGQHPRAPWP